MTRDEFIAGNPIAIVLEQRGVNVMGQGVQRTAKCCFHEDRTASMSVNVTSGLWHCHAGCGGGSVIDLLAKLDGIAPGEVLKRSGVSGTIVKATPAFSTPPKFETVCTYDYEDALGGMVYQVVRQHSPCDDKPCGYVKTFRQRRPGPNGSWVWDMEGIERVLFRLPEVLKSKNVWLVEGEKDAATLVSIGLCATCNVGGAGKWLDGYTESLAKKHVVICGDNDEPGQKHVKQVFDSIAGKVKTVRLVKIPADFKDVTDYAESFKDIEQFKRAILDLLDNATPFVKGVSLPIFKLSELEAGYQRHVLRMKESAYELSRWLPGLAKLRSLVAGELVLLLGATGIGKTAALSNIALSAFPIPTVFFELELPPEVVYERFVALKMKMACKAVEDAYRIGETLGEEAIDQKLSHIHVCTQPRLTVMDVETLVIKSELKIGERPKMVLLDYIGLVRGQGKSRYERLSQVAEDLKVMAKSTQTIVIVASQVSRKNDDDPEIGLSDGKDSGSLENSAGVVIGMWREDDGNTMKLRVLKSTKGGAGTNITCDYNVNTLAITQRSQFDDVPAKPDYANRD